MSSKAGKPEPSEASPKRGNRNFVIRPDPAAVHYRRGKACEATQDLDKAAAHYEKALQFNPGYVRAAMRLAGVQGTQARYREALTTFDRVLAAQPELAEAHCGRGIVLRRMKQYKAALASHERAIALKPDFANAHHSRATALLDLQCYEEAAASAERALALDPDNAHSHHALGSAHHALGRLDAALAHYEQAIARDPDLAACQWNRGLALLLQGDFQRGWPAYEWRWRYKDIPTYKLRREYREPRWTGQEPLDGKTLLLYPEQGLGDTLQFCRYVPRLKARGATVLLEAPAMLHGVLGTLAGVDRLLQKADRPPAFDYQSPLLSLPLAFGTRLQDIPASIPYLRSDPQKVSRWRQQLGPRRKPRVGLVWSGSPKHTGDRDRSIALADFRHALPAACEFISLQKELRRNDEALLLQKQPQPQIRDVRESLGDFSETAALCETLDLVISVDTSVAHLAGALGKPVWILLPFVPDWRWLLGRDDSPWYPGARLYRQTRRGDWSSLLARVRADLAAWAGRQ